MPKYQALKGMRDILPGEVERWQDLEAKARYFFEARGFEEIRTPLLEPTELFSRSVGEASDIVQKQMYTFDDRGGRTVTLRPEMTASVVRASIENGILRSSKTLRLYYLGAMFRAERPQRGRQRQFHQLGAEILNAKVIEADVEIIDLTHGLLKFFGVSHFRLNHNYLGSESDRETYAHALRNYFLKAKSQLCEDCHYRIEKNVLRVLDCKVPSCQAVIQSAPTLKLSAESNREYTEIMKKIEEKEIPTYREPRLVRGLDYYTGLVFEVVAEGELGSQDAVAAGGRYDGLISSLGGSEIGATGFAAGIERVLLAKDDSQIPDSNVVYVATLDSSGKTQKYFENILNVLRKIGRKVKREMGVQTLADHLKKANKMGIRCLLIIGEDEVRDRSVTVKDLQSKSQERVSLNDLPVHLVKKF